MSKELIEELRANAAALDGDLPGLLMLAADALEAKAAPVAYITGQFAGRCVIEAINRAAVLPTGMALYSHPQPSAGVVMPGRAEVSVRYGYRSMGYAEGWNDCLDEVASLNGKEVGRG